MRSQLREVIVVHVQELVQGCRRLAHQYFAWDCGRAESRGKEARQRGVCAFSILAQASLRVTVLLNTSLSGVESGSAQK